MAAVNQSSYKCNPLHLALVYKDLASLHNLSTDLSLDKNLLVQMANCMTQYSQQGQHITPMQAAVMAGNYRICKQLIIEGTEFFTLSFVQPPLFMALDMKKYQIARLLITAGASVCLPFNGLYPMYFAIKQDSPVFIAEVIIKAGFQIDAIVEETYGYTAIHRAIVSGNMDVLKLLIKYKADCNRRESERGFTPLHLAEQTKYSSFVKLLIENGADLELECKGGLTPLFYAISEKDPSSVSFLLKLGADVNHLSSVRQIYPLNLATFLRNKEIVDLLLKYGADPSKASPPSGDTALHTAAVPLSDKCEKSVADAKKIVELLVQNGCAVDIPNKFGYTPVQMAIKQQNFEIVEVLVKEGIAVNRPLDQGSNFHFVAKFANKQLIAMFLSYGADHSFQDNNGITPYHVAINNPDPNVLKLFWRFGCPFDIIKKDSIENQLASENILKMLETQRIFMLSLKGNDTCAMKRFLQLGAEVRGCSMEIPYPLHFAVSNGFSCVVLELLERGVPSNSFDDKGETPLHIAAQLGLTEICYCLLRYGACYNALAKSTKKTPLDLASENKHRHIVEVLEQIDSQFNSKGKNFGLKKELFNNFGKLQDFCNMCLTFINPIDRKGRTLLSVTLHEQNFKLAAVIMQFRLLAI